MFAIPEVHPLKWGLGLAKPRRIPAANLPWKIWTDRLLAVVLLIGTLPLLLLGAVLVKLTSRGPAIYTQIRMGKGRRPFVIYKLRTMRHNCESGTGARWSVAGDTRITPVGQFLRKSHIDELPQLWNVLRGEMSLVGPRPERPEFVSQLERAIPRYIERLDVLPGVTGLAQVHLPPDTDVESVRRKLRYDLHYVERISFGLDLRLIICTAFKVIGIPMPLMCRLLRLPAPETADSVAPREMVGHACPAEAAC